MDYEQQARALVDSLGVEIMSEATWQSAIGRSTLARIAAALRAAHAAGRAEGERAGIERGGEMAYEHVCEFMDAGGAVLKKYSGHNAPCAVTRGKNCTCGFDMAWARAEAAVRALTGRGVR